MTRLQKQWKSYAEALRLSVRFDVKIDVGGENIVAPVLLENFGARNGMVLVTDWGYVRPLTEKLAIAGYGYSTLREPVGEDFDVQESIEMLRDGGWTGQGAAPAWLDAS